MECFRMLGYEEHSCTRMWANIRTNEIWVQLSENQLSVGGNKMLK